MKLLFLTVVMVAAAILRAAPDLEQPVGRLRFEAAPLVAALRSLGRATGTTVLAEPEVAGEVTVEIRAGTLHGALSAMVHPLGYYFESEGETVVVRKRKTALYVVDYPQLARSGSGSASITLGGGGGGAVAGPTGTATATSAGADATQVSVSQENPNTFWTGLEAELRAMLKEGDALVLNRFSGVAQVTAARARHEMIREFIGLVNRRICRQVEIEAKLVEVSLRDERKLGIDWELAATAVGGVRLAGSAPLEVAGIGGALLAADTFGANVGFGRTTAVIQALQQQGEVNTVAQPRLRALNNQTAFIKVGEDRPFFRLQQATTFQQPGATAPFNQTQETFAVSTITIGTILAVTPQIDDEGVITLDVLPAITRLQAVVSSPDGRQTAPVTEVKQASTIVRLRDGETAVIGGLIAEDRGEGTRSVPILGAVPGIGRVFRARSALRHRTELVIFLTPRLVR